MDGAQEISRRCFLWSGAALGASLEASPRVKNEMVYRLATREWDVRMSVEFYNRYSSSGFWFEDRESNRGFCLSARGAEGRNCLANFSGSLAVVRYRIRSRSRKLDLISLREYVRTIDRDSRLSGRPPFERTLALQGGIASDIQAFGYEADASSQVQVKADHEPWCLLRQDLYFDKENLPFLVVHWKHALSAIRLLDVIPGDQTRMVESS